ncbi:MAG: Ankyrin repeat protein [Chlamydiales bacterium]|jgi:ankyrin repeat protein|nr:Ankyrin repeat protein [Chlamydiales bacterium]
MDTTSNTTQNFASNNVFLPEVPQGEIIKLVLSLEPSAKELLKLSRINKIWREQILKSEELKLKLQKELLAKLIKSSGYVTDSDLLGRNDSHLAISNIFRSLLDKIGFKFEPRFAQQCFNLSVDKFQFKLAQKLYQDYQIDPTGDDNKAIRFAAANGHIEWVDTLLKDERVDPTAYNHFCINEASKHGRLENVKRLLQDSRVDPSANDNQAVKQALQNGHYQIAKLLMQDPRFKFHNIDLSEPIENIVKSGDLELYKLFMEKASSLIIKYVNKGFQYACLHGQYEMAKDLLNRPEVNPTSDTYLALSYAYKGKNRAIIDLVLSDSRVSSCTDFHKVFAEACKNGRVGLINGLIQDQYIKDSEELKEGLQVAFNSLQIPVIQALLKQPSLHLSQEEANNYFLEACFGRRLSYGDKELFIKIWLDSGLVDPSYKDNQAICNVIESENLPGFELLMAHPNVDPAARNNEPICIVAGKRSEHAELMLKKLLKSPYVDPAARNNYPILTACEKGTTSMVKALLATDKVDPTVDNYKAFYTVYENEESYKARFLANYPNIDFSILDKGKAKKNKEEEEYWGNIQEFYEKRRSIE